MELIDQSEKSLYDKCKYEVKVWEHKFKKTNGRLPSRLDIKEADSKVRNAYKTYFRLKTAALERSFMGIDGFCSDEEQPICDTQQADPVSKTDEHCDMKKNCLPDSTWGKHLNKKPLEKSHSEPLKPAANLNQKFVSKLSVGSKLVKRNPRKSLSQNKHTTTSSQEKQNLNITSTSVPICRSYSEPVQVETNSVDLSSEISHPQLNTQRVKIVPANKVAPTSINIINDLMDRKVGTTPKLRNVDVKWLERVEINTEVHNKNETQVTKIDSISDEDIIDNSDDDSNCSSHVAKRFKYSNNVTPNFQKFIKHNIISDKLAAATSVANCASSTQTSELSQLSTVPSAENSISSVSQKGMGTKDLSTKSSQENENDSNKIESGGCSSYNNRNKEIDEHENEALTSLKKKKNLNENFVRVNLKKKIYARGKKTMNFSTYKKNLWKSRKKFMEQMEEGSDSSKKKFAKLMPLEDYASDEENNLLETLNEASGEVASYDPPSSTDLITPVCEEEDEDDLPLAVLKQTLPTSSQKEIKSTSSKPQLNTAKRKSTNIRVSQKKTGRNQQINSNSKKLKKKDENEDNLIETYDDTMEIETENKVIAQSNQHNFNDDDDFNLLLETIRVENMLDMKGVYPLYSPEDDGSLIETPAEVFNALRLFGHKSFREGQERAVMRILSGKSTLVTSSTGSGKSLCYQLPAYLFRQKYRCISLVISPLISLMEDQIKCMPGPLNAVCLHGNQTKTQRDIIIKALTDGDVSILMVSPESILSCDYSSGFGSILSRIPPIAFACLDEAHCLSQWSHNFRPSYLVVCQILQEKLGIKTILGLTATATQCTRDSLINQLQIPDGERGVIRDIPIPSNLILTVSRDMNREQALLELLLSKPFVDFTSIIIYCLRRNDCEKVASFLRASLKDYVPPSNSKKRKRISSQVEAYHAGLSGAKRKTIQNAFTSGDLRIVVATVAFGMGINKADIRSVIHFNMPANFESYVQEIGRAGRDRLPAHCHIFLDRQHGDVYELRRHIYGNSVDRHIIRKLLRKVFIPCKCEGTCLKHEIMFSVNSTVNTLDIPEEVISTLLCYLELHERKYIKVLKQSYGKCKVVSYGGGALIHKTALTCEPLKQALHLNENQLDNSNSIEFSIMKVSKVLNYDTGICKQILKNLEWTTINGQPKRSALNVEFSDLSFHLLSPGNLPDEDLDEVLDTLYNKVLNQENVAYAQLIDIDQTLSKVALPTCKNLNGIEEKSDILKKDIREYFESKKNIGTVQIPEITEEERNAIIRDIKLIVDRYGDENFTGRSIARIFHGIASPNFQPRVWGRTKFWRSHLKVHFNTICKIATSELIRIHA
ncbi:ATP-dependent DNA helicase Q4 [Coccinella septempunctata]|uniref:ATP-dependent DNA helicase Q4 n=1 Tax=Coccinella septempunctata TaxID=41139 RepID=UPI001D08E32F|nr:ATP-dependent DNA helicase Q4 [Coccinella septempunctata]